MEISGKQMMPETHQKILKAFVAFEKLSHLSVFVLHQGRYCCSGQPQLSLSHRKCGHRAVMAWNSRSGWCCRAPCGLQKWPERRNFFSPKSRPSSGRRCRSHRSMCDQDLQGYRALGERGEQSIPEHFTLDYSLCNTLKHIF